MVLGQSPICCLGDQEGKKELEWKLLVGQRMSHLHVGSEVESWMQLQDGEGSTNRNTVCALLVLENTAEKDDESDS